MDLLIIKIDRFEETEEIIDSFELSQINKIYSDISDKNNKYSELNVSLEDFTRRTYQNNDKYYYEIQFV